MAKYGPPRTVGPEAIMDSHECRSTFLNVLRRFDRLLISLGCLGIIFYSVAVIGLGELKAGQAADQLAATRAMPIAR